MAELPDDVTADILTFLPVKSLLRFRCVSKRLCSLIDGPDFIKRHLNRSLKTKTNHKLILGGNRYLPPSRNAHLYSVDLYELNQTVELDHPCGTKILGSVNGILCLNNGEKDIVFWNLATRKYHKLPVSEIDLSGPPRTLPATIFGFGYDSTSDDYKLLRLVQFYEKEDKSFQSEAKVYSLRSNAWQRIQDFPYDLRYDQLPGQLACSALHWVVSHRPGSDMPNLIVAFNLATNEYRLVDYPDILEKEISHVVNLEGRLCMLCRKDFERIDVWVMKNYGVKESWSKLFTVSRIEVIRLLMGANPLAYSKSGTEIMLLQKYKKILWYSIKEGRVRMIHLRGCPDNFQPEVCVESLVPLSGKYEDYAKKKSEKGANEKQIKGAKKRDHSLISGFQVEAQGKGTRG